MERTAECIHCEAEIVESEGIWYHARIEDFSHLARPKPGTESEGDA